MFYSKAKQNLASVLIRILGKTLISINLKAVVYEVEQWTEGELFGSRT